MTVNNTDHSVVPVVSPSATHNSSSLPNRNNPRSARVVGRLPFSAEAVTVTACFPRVTSFLRSGNPRACDSPTDAECRVRQRNTVQRPQRVRSRVWERLRQKEQENRHSSIIIGNISRKDAKARRSIRKHIFGRVSVLHSASDLAKSAYSLRLCAFARDLFPNSVATVSENQAFSYRERRVA